MNKIPILILLLFLSSGASAQLAIGTLNRVTKSEKGGVYSSDSLYFQTVDGTYPGLMTVQQKLDYDSLYNGLKFDTTYLIGQGSGTPIMRSSSDSIYFNTLVPGTGITFTHNADSSISIASSGYNVVIPYGNGHIGIPIKGGDSIYVNTNLIGKHIIVYATNNTTTTRLADSIEWVMTGSSGSTPYIRFNTALGEVIFCNFSNDSSIKNGATALSIFGGAQGSYANVDNGTPQPTISATPTTITGMTDTAGAVGTPVYSIVSGMNLTGNIIVTAPANFLVSTNNATFSSSVTLTESGGTVSSTPIWIQIASTATSGSIGPSNVTCTSSGASAVNIAVSGTVYGATGYDSMTVQFVHDASEEAPGCSYMLGNLQAAADTIYCIGGIHSNIRVTANQNYWAPYNAANSTVNDGPTTNSVWPWQPKILQGLWYVYAQQWSASPDPSLTVIGLIPGKTYTINVSGSLSNTNTSGGTLIASNVDSAMTYVLVGSFANGTNTGPYPFRLNSGTNFTLGTPNSTQSTGAISWIANSLGEIDIWIDGFTSNTLSGISAMKIIQMTP